MVANVARVIRRTCSLIILTIDRDTPPRLPLPLEVAACDEHARTTLRASVDSLVVLDFTWAAHHQRMGRESVSAIHKVHEPFGETLSVHAAWDVGGGGACSERIPPNGSRFISYPGETLKPTPPRETTFCEGCHSTPTPFFWGSQSSPSAAGGGARSGAVR